jgi:glycosyltransferase involved in cell wall biosynthesis
MRILLAAPTFGVHGGIEAFVMALADWLPRNTPHEARVCFKLVGASTVTQALDERCRQLGLNYEFVRRGSPSLLRAIAWADVVHGNTCSPDIAIYSKLAGKPLVLTIHNWFRGRRGLRNRVWLFCNRIADWRTYNSSFVLNTWEPQGRRANSDLIPTVSHLPERQTPFDARKGFFFIARLIENKGLDVLVRAYEIARLDKRQWPLSIAGDGPLRGWLDGYIAANKVVGVKVLGFLPEAEKARQVAASMWLIAPASNKEDMGLTPIEARSVAVPAIVTRDGGLPEAAGDSALLCEPGDVQGLGRTLEQAASMSAADYRSRAERAQQSLREYLRPLSDYVTIYERVTGATTPLSVHRALAPGPKGGL